MPTAPDESRSRAGSGASTLPHMKPLPERAAGSARCGAGTRSIPTTTSRSTATSIRFRYELRPKEGRRPPARPGDRRVPWGQADRQAIRAAMRRGRATTARGAPAPGPPARRRGGGRARGSSSRARDIGPHVHAFVVAVMERQPQPGVRFPFPLRRAPPGGRPRARAPRQRLPLPAGSRRQDLARARQHPAHRSGPRRRRDGSPSPNPSSIPTSGGPEYFTDERRPSCPTSARPSASPPCGCLACWPPSGSSWSRHDPRRHAVRGPARAAGRPRGRRAPLAARCGGASGRPGSAIRTPASRRST